MRIPVFYNIINKEKVFLHIEKAYKPKYETIPLGCDCHPAYVLQKLHIRKFSLPFDWLNNSSIQSIAYVNRNFNDDFDRFIQKLTLNERGNVVSKFYPYCEFLHEPNLLNNEEDKNKFKRRIKRLLNLKKNNEIHYINNITSQSINSREKIDYFLASVKEFATKYLKETDLLSIYIRFDESYNENQLYTNQLEEELNKIQKVKCIKYLRNQSKYPTWGNPKYYPKLLEDLGVKISTITIKVYLKKS